MMIAAGLALSAEAVLDLCRNPASMLLPAAELTRACHWPCCLAVRLLSHAASDPSAAHSRAAADL